MGVSLRKMELRDYEQVVNMHIDFIATIYPNRELGEYIHFYNMVSAWINHQKHIYVTEKDGELTGYSVSSVDYNHGLTEPVYFGEIAYVKPKYRKGKSAYLLYNNVVNIADELGLRLTANAFISKDKIDQIQEKFSGEPQFIVYERR